MYIYARRLQSHAKRTVFLLRDERDAFVAAKQALLQEQDPSKRWFVTLPDDYSGRSMSGLDSDIARLHTVTVPELDRGFYLSETSAILAEVHLWPTAAATPSAPLQEELLAMLAQARLYEKAAVFASLFHLDMAPLFSALLKDCYPALDDAADNHAMVPADHRYK